MNCKYHQHSFSINLCIKLCSYAGTHQPQACTHLVLKIAFVQTSVCVCMCVCVYACVNHNKKLFRRSPLCPLLLNSEDTVDGLYLLLPYSLGENFQGFCLTLKILLSKILMLQRRFLKLISSLWFKLTVPLVIDILSVHYLG